MGGGGGKGGTSTSTVSIPPEVLARYNSVNARAEEVAKQPFQSYGGEFVAPLTQTQQQGVSQTQDYSQAAQPYYQTAAGMTGSAAQAVQPYYGAAAGITGAALVGAQPYYGAATGITNAALAGIQPNYQQAYGMTTGAANAAQPSYQQALGMTTGAVNAAQPNYQQAYGMTTGAANAAQPSYQQALGITNAALAGIQPNYQQAYGMTTGSANAAQPLYGAAELQTLRAGQPLSPQQIQQYQNPFVQSVVDPTLQALRQQQGIDLSRQQAQQIQSGAYGGDRAGLSRAMLQGQQGLAQAQAISPLYQSAYQNALQAAQQQQQVGLAGAQQLGSLANQQLQGQLSAGQQLGALTGQQLQGQLGAGQQLGTLANQQLQGQLSAGQQLGALTGQQLQGQLGAGQQLGTLAGQQLQGQLGAGQQLGALTGQQYTNALSGAQQLAGIGGQQYTNALAGAQQLAGIGGQQLQGQLSSAQQLAGIGTGAQQAGLQGAQAVIGAGTLGQQTKQAQDTAQYQQFLQQRGYDFQTAQFLANIAEGTGALSGSTTTTTQPTSFFSDERLKHDIKKIGKTNDGQPIYSFKYNGDDRTQIGLLAQEVEKKHPEAVGLSGGYKTVDYAKATAGARHARAMGGLVPESMGGAVFEPGNFARGGDVGGGLVTDPNDIQAILAAQKQSMGPFGQSGLYGGSSQQDPHGAVSGYVPKATLPVPKLVTSSFQPKAQQSELQTAMQGIGAAGQTAETLGKGWDAGKRGLLGAPATDKTAASSGLLGAGGKYDIGKGWFGDDVTKSAYGGGIMPRHHFANGGPEDSMQDDFTTPGLVKEDKVEGKENRANVPASGFPTDVLSSGTSAKELAVAKNPSTSSGQSGMSSLAQGLGAANNALKAGKSISTMIGGGADAIGGGGTFAAGMGPFMSEAGVGAAGAGAAEGAGILGGLGSAIGSIGQAAMAILPFFGLSDARLKDNIKQVGKTFDGQNIYSYDMGDGRTQMGLLAQEVLHHKPEAVGEKQGYLTVDYRKATEDSAPHRAAGGLVPRQGYQEGGPPESNVVSVPDFNKAVSRTFEFEGGLNPADTNGTPSLYGINQAAHPEFFKNPSKEAAANIYKTQYWDAIGADKLDPRLAHVAYDTAVISGPGKAQEFIKQSGGDPEKLLQLRRQFQDNLIAQDPGKYGKYEKAWNNRLSTLAGDISASAPNQPQAGPQPQAAGVKPWYDKMAPTTYQGSERPMSEFLTSKDFVIPLLTGLGTMASSPSRYLGSAILQGLGGAAQAYQGVQKQQADIGQTLATTGLTGMETEGKRQEMVTGAFKVQTDGRATITYRDRDGSIKLMPAAEYYALPKDKQFRLDPVSEANLQEYARKIGLVSTSAPTPAPAPTAGGLGAGKDVVTPPPGAVTTPPPAGEVTPPPPAGGPSEMPQIPGVNIKPDHLKQIQESAKTLESQSDNVISRQPKATAYNDQAVLATAAQAQRPQMMSFAASLAALPRDGSILTSGKQQEVFQPLSAVLNGLAATLKLPSFVSPEALANTEEVKKSVNLLAQAAAKGGNQASYSALNEIMSSIPSNLNSPGAQAKLISDIMAVQQREIDKDKYFATVKKQAEGPNRLYSRGVLGTGAEAERAFNDSNGAKIEQEKQQLTRMFNEQAKGHFENGRPVSVMEYLAKNAGTLSDKQRAAIENNYGKGILRYFGAGN